MCVFFYAKCDAVFKIVDRTYITDILTCTQIVGGGICGGMDVTFREIVNLNVPLTLPLSGFFVQRTQGVVIIF